MDMLHLKYLARVGASISWLESSWGLNAKAAHESLGGDMGAAITVHLMIMRGQERWMDARTVELIKESGFYTCDCAAFEYSRKEEDGVGFPCKHLCSTYGLG